MILDWFVSLYICFLRRETEKLKKVRENLLSVFLSLSVFLPPPSCLSLSVSTYPSSFFVSLISLLEAMVASPLICCDMWRRPRSVCLLFLSSSSLSLSVCPTHASVEGDGIMNWFAATGPAKKTKIQDAETNKLTAYHEAGHTLVAYFTKDAIPLHKVTIIPRGMSLGHVSLCRILWWIIVLDKGVG